ncbi:MAG TPA: Asp-tRNA(Asn)/Glu-tRNA(Gln) amidotransferase subunit GatB, partial [Candidatus Wirthbacteria bacterium]|nr:Asp-tRNA(Asn)/Glu-tRNA(Gln) amidotransferase subunit GatB [Candidatus Wirthbacteria bacterium]
LEIHVQLKTKSKMFCRCNASYFGAEPNTQTCPVCLGLPGALPVINRAGIEQSIKVGLALDCQIAEYSQFDRKHYFYPDLVKGYQITQLFHPLCINGHLQILAGKKSTHIRINRAHLEEDTAKSIHEQDPITGESYTLLDCNKSGLPLLEIVSEPDIRSIEEANAYARAIQQIVRWIDGSDCDMEKGQMRFDINVSIGIIEGQYDYRTRPLPEKFTPITEVKNLNSFRALEKALAYEIDRQIKQYEQTNELYSPGKKQTRGWDYDKEQTVFQRSKEEAMDYRYIPDPDLPPLTIESAWVESIKKNLPELPKAKASRWQTEYQLTEAEASILTQDIEAANWFEKAVSNCEQALVSDLAKWLVGDISYLLNENSLSLSNSPLKADSLIELVTLIQNGEISGKIAKDILPEIVLEGKSAKQLVETKGLKQVSDKSELTKLAQAVIQENPKVVEQIQTGKEGAIMFLMGQVMKKSQGQANPELVLAELKKELRTN